MTTALRNVIVVGVVLILLFEIGGRLYKSSQEAEAKQPLDRDGKIKDGMVVSFEEEEQLAINSFPTVKEREQAEGMLYAFSQCLIGAEAIGDNAYICLSNNVKDEALALGNYQDDVEKGKMIKEKIENGQRVTGVQILGFEEERTAYTLQISFNRDALKRKALFVIEDKKIASIKWLDESEEY